MFFKYHNICLIKTVGAFETYAFVAYKFFVTHSLVRFQLGHGTLGRFSITETFCSAPVVIPTFKLTSFEGTIVTTAWALFKT